MYRAFVWAPLSLLLGFSFLVRTADSSNDFRRDQDWVLERLRNRIEQSVATREEAEVASEPGPFVEVRRTVRRGDTFTGILQGLGEAGPEEARFWVKAARLYPQLARLRPDRDLVFLIDPAEETVSGLQYAISPSEILSLRREDDGIVGAVEKLPTTTEVRVAGGRIETSLYRAAVDGGVPDSVVSSFVDVFSWEVDFTRDVRRGDEFRVAYEVIHDGNGGGLRGGRVLAAEIDTGRRQLQAVYFDDGTERGSYYAPDGKSLGRGFLRYPLEFTRISSQFTRSRFHPVLGVRRPHFGVDFAAPVGTPIRAIGPGRIATAGWKGGNGRFVKIEHHSGIASSYSHLRSIANGIRPGARVERGQVIGTVGASGLATGPHLHFAMYRNGVYVNPMRFQLPSSPPLTADRMPAFERTRDEVLEQLATAEVDAPARVVRLASATGSR